MCNSNVLKLLVGEDGYPTCDQWVAPDSNKYSEIEFGF